MASTKQSAKLLKLLGQLIDDPERKAMPEVIELLRNDYPVFPSSDRLQQDLVYIQGAYTFDLGQEKRTKYRLIALERGAISSMDDIPITFLELARKYGTPSFKPVWDIVADVTICICPDKYTVARMTNKVIHQIDNIMLLDHLLSRPGIGKLVRTSGQSIYLTTAEQAFPKDVWETCRREYTTVKYKNIL